MLTGIVLAGGKSSRMGKDKSLLKVNGKTLIEIVINELNKVCSEVIISANFPELYKDFENKVVSDMKKDFGPLMGVYSSMKQSKNNLNFVVACDMPNINSIIIEQMIYFAKDNDVVIFENKGFLEPLFTIYKKSKVFSLLGKMIEKNETSLQKLFPICKTKILRSNEKVDFTNLNHNKDLENFIKTQNNKS